VSISREDLAAITSAFAGAMKEAFRAGAPGDELLAKLSAREATIQQAWADHPIQVRRDRVTISVPATPEAHLEKAGTVTAILVSQRTPRARLIATGSDVEWADRWRTNSLEELELSAVTDKVKAGQEAMVAPTVSEFRRLKPSELVAFLERLHGNAGIDGVPGTKFVVAKFVHIPLQRRVIGRDLEELIADGTVRLVEPAPILRPGT
jgi:hypothetical protein